MEEWSRILELAPTDMGLLPGLPRLLGYIPQRFRVYGGDVAATYAKYLPRIEKSISSELVTVLRRFNSELAPFSGAESNLGQVKDFGTIATASQVEGKPMKDVYLAEDERTPETPVAADLSLGGLRAHPFFCALRR